MHEELPIDLDSCRKHCCRHQNSWGRQYYPRLDYHSCLACDHESLLVEQHHHCHHHRQRRSKLFQHPYTDPAETRNYQICQRIYHLISHPDLHCIAAVGYSFSLCHESHLRPDQIDYNLCYPSSYHLCHEGLHHGCYCHPLNLPVDDYLHDVYVTFPHYHR